MPTFKNLASFQVGWPKKFLLAFWPDIKLVGLKKFIWPFFTEIDSYEGKYYYSIFFGNTIGKFL